MNKVGGLFVMVNLLKLVKGQVKSLEIPRPRAGQDVTGVGKIFVEFTNTEGSNKGTDIIFQFSVYFSFYSYLFEFV